MNIFYKIYCRIYQFIFRLLMPLLPFREPKVLDNNEELAVTLKNSGIKKVMIVASGSVLKYNSRYMDNLECELGNKSIKYEIFDQVRGEPDTDVCELGREFYLKHDCQAIIAIGGGSQLDCAKVIGALVKYPKKNVRQLKGTLKVLKKLPLLIAIPTTAGTGSEATVAAVIKDKDTHQKYTLNNFTMIPKYAILNTELTYSVPQKLTYTTGMDALTHAVEAYIGQSTTKRTRKLAMEACNLILKNIENACSNAHNYNAKKNMLEASYMAGCAFTRSYVGYIHAIAHTLGGKYDILHGEANSVIMPIVLREYGDSVSKKLNELAIYSGLVDKNEMKEIGALRFIEKIEELNEKMEMPKFYFSEDCQDEVFDELIKNAMKEANPLYPVPKLWGKEEFIKIYRKLKKC